MAMMAVVSSTPVVRGVSVATVIRIWLGIRVVRSPIVPVGIIIGACRISVIACRKSKTESHSGNPDSHLSVSTLAGNQANPLTANPIKRSFFIDLPLLFVSVLLFVVLRGMRLRVSLYRGIGNCRSRGSRMGDIPVAARQESRGGNRRNAGPALGRGAPRICRLKGRRDRDGNRAAQLRS